MNSKRLSSLSDIVVIVVGVAVLFAWWSQIQHRRNGQGSSAGISVGASLTNLHADWTRADETVVLLLNKDCRYCAESAGFYRQLIKPRSPKVQYVVAFPHDLSAGKEYLDRMQIPSSDVQVVQMPFGRFSTPTILVCDRKGAVRKLWVGKLSEPDQQAVVKTLAAGT